MTKFSDELLMSYVDGELGNADRARVEAHVAQSDDSIARLEIFKATGRRLGDLYLAPMVEPVPQHLVDAVLQGVVAEKPPAAEPAKIIAFNAARRLRPSASSHTWMRAAACVTLLAAGVGVFVQSNRVDESFGLAKSAEGARIAGVDLAAVLDTSASGSSAEKIIQGMPSHIEPILTFVSSSGDYCRQYAIGLKSETGLRGVACRDGAAHWRVEAQVLFGGQGARSKTTDYKLLGRQVAKEIETVVDRLIAGDALGGDAEATLIRGGWKAAR